MAGGQDITMTESSESKLDAIMNALATLSQRIAEIEGVMARLHNDGASVIAQAGVHQSQSFVPEGAAPPSTQQDPMVQQRKEPRVSLPDKFDGTRAKFRGFVNQIRLITALQPERYPTEESRVGLVGTLLTGQALSWFAPLFEKQSPILNNFGTFLEAFAEAFGEHDKARWATTKIRSLRQGTRFASVYASDFRQLACDINWDEEALMSQFYWGLRDDVKDLLLSLPDPRTLNEAISQAVKCDNRLFQRRQDQRSRQYTIRHAPTMSASSLNTNSEAEDMQIDAVRVKTLSPEERKRRMEEGLCLYCGEVGHKVGSCPKKQNRRTVRTRGAIVQENQDTQPQ
jgi:Retrotransposon gag protein